MQHIISHLKPGGRAAVIMPNGTLTSQIYREAGIREAIVQDKRVEAIIALPAGLFYTTKVACCIWLLADCSDTDGAILFINAAHMKPEIKHEFTTAHAACLTDLANRHRQRKLYDRTEWYGIGLQQEIAQNDFLLSPNFYLLSSRPDEKEIAGEYKKFLRVIEGLSALILDETLLCSIKGWKNAERAVKWEKAPLLALYDGFGGVTKSKEFFGSGAPVLDVKTVVHSPYIPEHLSGRVEVSEEEKIKYDIKCGDMFLNRTSETLEELACCCVAPEDRDAVYGGFIKRLRPRGKAVIDPLYAAGYFRSEIYRWEVENVSTVFTTYASIDNRKLSRIAVYFPDMDMQQKIGRTLYEVFRFQNNCVDPLMKKQLKEFERLLIREYITYPIVYMQRKEGDGLCR